MDPAEVLLEVSRQVSNCKRCGLHFSRKKPVPGSGPANAKIMFIGEGPGFYENQQGLPFVGAAGKFLDELLAAAGLRREAVFITNVVKCRPPGNRDPQADELAACNDYLDRQINAINPALIVTLGRFSMAKFLPNAKISEVHGQTRWVKDRLVVAMYHPAAALHQPTLRPVVEADFARLPEFVKMAESHRPAAQAASPAAEAEPSEEDLGSATQLSLF